MNKQNSTKDKSLVGKTILFLNTGSSSTFPGTEDIKSVIKRIGELGMNVVAVSKEANIRQKFIKHWILSELFEHDKTIRAIEEFLTNHPEVKIDGAITFHEDTVLLASKVIEKFKLIGAPFKVADLARNKFKFREFCAQHGLPTPKFMKINSRADLIKVQERLEFPIVLKPIYGAASAFVIKVENKESLFDVYDYIRKNISKKIETCLDALSVILAEEYIEGDEVDINILIQNGRIKFYNITDNHQTNEPFFIETGMTEPSALLEPERKALVDMADEVLEILKIQNCCLQFEAKSTQNGPMPLEINLRMGCDEAYYFAKEAWGVDMIEGAMKIATGVYLRKVDKRNEPKKYFAGETLHAPYSGVVAKIEIDNSLKDKKYIENLVLSKKVGDTVLAPPFGYDYMGWVAVSGPNPVDASDKLRLVLKKINYQIAKFDESSSIGRTIRKGKNRNAILSAIKSKKIMGKEKIEKIRLIPLSAQRKLHIGVAYNDYSAEKDVNIIEKDLYKIGKNIEETLIRIGYKVTLFDFNSPLKAINEINKSKVDLIFNVCERINETSLLEPHAASVFDILQIPYTGSNPATLALCIDKIRAKKLLNHHNIPTPKWDYVYDLNDEISEELKFPMIVKPANTDNSIGITNESVVTDRASLKERIKYVIKSLGCPALVEEYIDGDEYDIFIIGAQESNIRVLPLSRTIFSGLPEKLWHIRTLKAKYGLDEVFKKNVVVEIPPKKISEKMMSLLSEIAIDTYNIFECQDYGKVEIKVDKNNNPYVLELNPNPSLNLDDPGPLAAKVSGIKYNQFLEEIIRMAIERYKKKPPYYQPRIIEL